MKKWVGGHLLAMQDITKAYDRIDKCTMAQMLQLKGKIIDTKLKEAFDDLIKNPGKLAYWQNQENQE